MFDIANPQKRERLLIIFACVALCFIVINMLPAQFRAINALRNVKNDLEQRIDERQRLAQDKEQIERRLAAMEQRALATGGDAEFRYRMWLDDLVASAGLNVTAPTSPPTRSGGARGSQNFARHAFTIVAEGRLDQIAEFLRRFHRTEYLHSIQSIQMRTQSRPGIIPVTFRIEALSLPQVETVNMPNTEGIAATSEERQLLSVIQERAILSEYRPPAPTPPPDPEIPPPPTFDDIPFCFLEGITLGLDGRPQCWIRHRTRGISHRLFEGETFILGGHQCTIRKVDIDNQRIFVEIAGGLFSLRAGQNFDQVEEVLQE